MIQTKLQLKPWIVWLVIAIMPLIGFTIDIYTPALPTVAKFLHAPESEGKLTISIFIVGYGLGQFFTGPLSDRFGRRKTLLISFFIYFLASIFAAFSQTMTMLFLMRLLQGLAVSGQILNIRAIMVDSFEGEDSGSLYVWITACYLLTCYHQLR